MNFNRVLRLADFTDPALAPLIEALFGPGVSGDRAYRKAWEVAMALRSADAFTLGGEDTRALGLGAGMEPTSFALTRTFGHVIATDLYETPGLWPDTANRSFLTDPAAFAPSCWWIPSRLTVQHMDMRAIDYPDESFDFIYSSSSIEHVSDDIADLLPVMAEMARVLRPDGIVSLSTEYNLNSAPGTGWEGVQVFSRAAIERLIAAGDFERVDTPSWTTDEAALATRAPLTEFVDAHVCGEHKLPDIVLEDHGFLFTSVHLCLRKRHS